LREVSCRAFAPFFRECRRQKLPPDFLTSGTEYTVDHLRDAHEWVSWQDHARIAANAHRVFSDEDLERMGGDFIKNPLFRAITVVARLLFSTKEFYRWGYSEAGPKQIFKCVHSDYHELAENRFSLELTIPTDYPPCPEFFIITRGGLAQVPRLFGLPPASVATTAIPNGMQYQVTFPLGGGLLPRLWRVLTWPFTVSAAGRELKAANEALVERHNELEQARLVLELQATQQGTAYQISQIIRNEIGLERTLAAIGLALIDEARLAGVEIRLDVEVSGKKAEAHRIGRQDGEVLRFVVEGRGRIVGELALWPGSVDQTRLRTLLQFVLPTIAMAIEDAITYTELVDYRENLERKVEQRTLELKQAHDTLEATVARMIEAQETRDRLFANINHEIRTPLQLVLASADDLRKRLGAHLDDEAARRLRAIEAASRMLLRLIDGLLQLAAAQEGRLAVKQAPLDLVEILQVLFDMWRPIAESHRLTLVLDAPERCVALADDAAVERIVSNLISNAVKFTPDGGSVTIQLRAVGESAALVVRDTGIGLSDEFRARVFGRFEQGSPPVRPGTSGNGIGLSLVRELARAHGGDATVESKEGEGSAFTITLPLAPADVVPDEYLAAPYGVPRDYGHSPAAADPDRVLSPPNAPRATILVAEDDPDVRSFLGILFVEEGYRAILAGDGASALRLAEEHRPDLLVSDVGMPRMDGFELTRRFRELPGNRMAPVVLLTAYAKLTDRLTGFDAGAIDYVLKPCNPSELLARVRSQLEQRATSLKLFEAEKLAALGTLSAGLAHEMRNPANAIVNAIDPLVDLLPTELLEPNQPIAQLIQVMRDCADQVARLSRQLLDFKRSGELIRHDTPFASILQRARSLVGSSLQRVTLREAIEYRGSVWCAGSLVTQALSNLLDNCAQAAGPGGSVVVAARAERGRLIVEVSDSGPGVPTSLRERIFEPFFTTKPPGQGTGLGLTTAREIAVRHGGTLEVRDAQRGTLFRLELPYARPEVQAQAGATP